MAITKHLFAIYIQGMTIGFYNLDGTTIRAGLFTSAWPGDWNNNFYYTQLTDYECADEGFSGGYVTNGRALQNVAISDDPAEPWTLSSNHVTWEVLTATFRYLLFWDGDSGLLIGGLDYGTDQVYQAQEFILEMPNGVLTVSAG